MLALLFTSLIAVCVDSSERRLTPREEQFLSGIECLRAELKKDCLTVTDGDGNSRCEWKDYACSALSRESSLADVNGPAPPMPTAPVDAAPTAPSDNDPSLTAPKPTAPVDAAPAAIDTVGCCRGFSLKTQVVCQSFEDQMDCENEYCDWVETDDHTDCLLIDPIRPTRANYDDSDSADNESTTSSVPITTTSIESILTTEEEMGCCRGNTAMIDEDKCHENTAPALCIKHDNCQWLVGNKRDLCAPLQLPTTTSTPDDYDEETSTTEAIAQSTDSVTSESTTESEPSTTESEDGCCKGDAPETNEKCNGHIEATLCAKDENCEWMVGSETDLCEFELPSTTTDLTMNDGLLTTSTQTTLGGWAGAKHRRVRTDESVLFGRVQGSVVNRSLDYALSLSGVLIFAIAISVVYAVYRWLRSCREYTKISDPRETDARTHITYESA